MPRIEVNVKNVYTVSQVNGYIKNIFAEDYLLRNVSIKGEISNCKYYTSGHIYFKLKDAGAVMSGVMFFRSQESGLKFKLKDGMKVIVSGSVTAYERDGIYQIIAKNIQLDGEGDLYRQFEELKNRLMEMGMFDEAYKKPIPRYCQRIGIVTAATGAAIQDIKNIAYRRNPYVQLYLYSAQVQGEGASRTIVNGIRALDQMGLDVLIVGRGGGSIEDLWAFNEEAVARAIFECNTPVISAVGHEIDFTIADFVSDLRAPTPSAAAELAVFELQKVLEQLEEARTQLYKALKRQVQLKEELLEKYTLLLRNKSPEAMIQNRYQHLDMIQERLYKSMERLVLDKKHKLAIMCERLNGLSPLKKLSSGYGYITDIDKKPITSKEQVRPGDAIDVQLTDGRLRATVEKIIE